MICKPFLAAQQSEQIIAIGVYHRWPLNGAFLFGGSMDTNDFFQTEARRCRDNAEKATKTDRDFWLTLASKWEELLSARTRNSANVEAVKKLRPTRTIYNTRRRVA
jgi:hypothetical protein